MSHVHPALRALVPKFRQDQGFLMASAMSFVALLCLAPLALILFSLAGFLMESDEIAEYLFDAATLLLPAYGYELAEFLTILARERAVTGLLGVLGWAVFATQFFSLTRTVLNRAFGVRARRGVLHGFALDLLAVTLAGLLATGFAVVVALLEVLGEAVGRFMPLPALSPATVRQILKLPLIYVTGLAGLFFVYRTMPNTRGPARAAAIATLAVAVAWEAARWAFTAYVGMFGTYGRLYGSFGVGVAALVWIYYSATIFVLGAELAALLTGRRPAPPEATAS